eukprot:9858683-Prorocentrum_lima.AAC.1
MNTENAALNFWPSTSCLKKMTLAAPPFFLHQDTTYVYPPDDASMALAFSGQPKLLKTFGNC